jgi:hypothetical protein
MRVFPDLCNVAHPTEKAPKQNPGAPGQPPRGFWVMAVLGGGMAFFYLSHLDTVPITGLHWLSKRLLT